MSQSPDPMASDALSTSPRRKHFSEQFKRDAVRLITHEQYSYQAAAVAVGVSDNSLRNWHKRYAPQAQPCGQDASAEQLQTEVGRLRKQLRRAEMERDILKKATAYFASQNT